MRIKQAFTDPTEGLEIHFDIEGHTPTSRDYLFGFLLRSPGREAEYLSFVAEKPEEEEKMWRAFVAWTETLPASYTVFHYASHESTRLATLAKRYGDEDHPSLTHFRTRLIDLKNIMADTAVFPIYFYSLKAIAGFLGHAWTGEVKGGGASVTAYDTWLETGDRAILESIIHYNREDVEATALALDWLRGYATQETLYAKPYPWMET